jgi:hypothetical protein
MQKKHANKHKTFSSEYQFEDMMWLFTKNIKTSLTVELGFGQKFKSDPRVDVLSGWTDQRFQFDPRIDVRRILSSLFDINWMR